MNYIHTFFSNVHLHSFLGLTPLTYNYWQLTIYKVLVWVWELISEQNGHSLTEFTLTTKKYLKLNKSYITVISTMEKNHKTNFFSIHCIRFFVLDFFSQYFVWDICDLMNVVGLPFFLSHRVFDWIIRFYEPRKMSWGAFI